MIGYANTAIVDSFIVIRGGRGCIIALVIELGYGKGPNVCSNFSCLLPPL